jgi:hypothetical protein
VARNLRLHQGLRHCGHLRRECMMRQGKTKETIT